MGTLPWRGAGGAGIRPVSTGVASAFREATPLPTLRSPSSRRSRKRDSSIAVAAKMEGTRYHLSRRNPAFTFTFTLLSDLTFK